MKKPEAFNSWCAKMGIIKRSYDESLAWAAWQEGYMTANSEAMQMIDEEIAHLEAARKEDGQ